MKKALLLLSILFISVLTTACINNLAVQELNNKAAYYIEQGNFDEAISRLKSSIDLDGSLYESHYNLAVAYTMAQDYANAIKSYERSIELNPEFADAYYSLAVAQEDVISDLNSGILEVSADGNLSKTERNPVDTELEEQVFKVSDVSMSYISELTQSAIKNYEIYLEKNPSAKEVEEVKNRVKDLSLKLSNHSANAAQFAKD